MHRTVCLLTAAVILFLSACSLSGINQPAARDLLPDWAYTDLRGIDPADATQPEQDILAGYMRRNPASRSGLDIRLDFLDQSLNTQRDLLLAFDFLPGGVKYLPSGDPAEIEWDALLQLPSGGPIQGYDREYQPMIGLAVRQLHNSDQDSLQVSLDGGQFFGTALSDIPPSLKVQAFTTSSTRGEVLDRSPVLHMSAPPPQPARLLLAFWNTYPATTPAQALRRWDGAHTGLFGGRDGLFNLLRMARNHSVPVVLLDLKNPYSLSALDYAGDLNLVESLISSGSVTAPDVWMGNASEDLAELSVQWAHRFKLPSVISGYAQSASLLPDGYPLAFVPGNAAAPITQVTRSSSQKIIPLPATALAENSALRLAPDGLSIAARQLLADFAAQNNNASSFAVLGGDLAQSGWGSPEAARRAFSYIQDHPWIQVIRPGDLAYAQPAAVYDPGNQPSPAGEIQPVIAFPVASSNPLDQTAAQSLLVSSGEFTRASPEFLELKNIYDTQARVLLAAARWSENPTSIATCEEDVDLDALPECILASEMIYTVYDLELGALTHAFTLSPDGPHQWIGPSSQLSYGSGDPAAWDLESGLAADPTVIPGAFASPPAEGGARYAPQMRPGELALTSPEGSLVKNFTLQEDGLAVEIDGLTNSVELPLVIDPWLRFQPNWWEQYTAQQEGNSISWGTPNFQVKIASPQELTLSAFNDTRQLMGRVENPNTEYPPGHYLPFPLALVEAVGGANLPLRISIYTR